MIGPATARPSLHRHNPVPPATGGDPIHFALLSWLCLCCFRLIDEGTRDTGKRSVAARIVFGLASRQVPALRKLAHSVQRLGKCNSFRLQYCANVHVNATGCVQRLCAGSCIGRHLHSQLLKKSIYFNCTDPDTVTSTVLLPASTGTGASLAAALASIAIMRGRGTKLWSLALTDTSRSV